jgi:hypothetical protein
LLHRDPNAAYIPDPGVKVVEFRALGELRNGILAKVHLSIGKGHPGRRPPVSPQDVAVSVERTTLTLRRFCQWSITNMHETSWKVIENHAYKVSISGIEGVKALFAWHPIICPIAIASINVTGGRLATCVIAKVVLTSVNHAFPRILKG